MHCFTDRQIVLPVGGQSASNLGHNIFCLHDHYFQRDVCQDKIDVQLMFTPSTTRSIFMRYMTYMEHADRGCYMYFEVLSS